MNAPKVWNKCQVFSYQLNTSLFSYESHLCAIFSRRFTWRSRLLESFFFERQQTSNRSFGRYGTISSIRATNSTNSVKYWMLAENRGIYWTSLWYTQFSWKNRNFKILRALLSNILSWVAPILAIRGLSCSTVRKYSDPILHDTIVLVWKIQKWILQMLMSTVEH